MAEHFTKHRRFRSFLPGVDTVTLIIRKGVGKLNDDIKLKDLIIKAQNGDEESIEEILNRLLLLIKKYSYKLGYEDASADLQLWILEAIHGYKPNAIWETNDFDKMIKEHLDNE